MENTQSLISVSHEEFTKKVEVEAAHLMHFNNLEKHVADKVAHEIVSKQFSVH
jgi:hypothetical protein